MFSINYSIWSICLFRKGIKIKFKLYVYNNYIMMNDIFYGKRIYCIGVFYGNMYN